VYPNVSNAHGEHCKHPKGLLQLQRTVYDNVSWSSGIENATGYAVARQLSVDR